MRRLEPCCRFFLVTFSVGCVLLLSVLPVSADRLSLMSDLKYEVTNTETMDKAAKTTRENDRARFSQIYTLELQKEIFPTLSLNAGGLFDQDSTRTKTDEFSGQDSDSLDTTIRPYVELQFATPLLKVATGYRKNEIKQSASTSATERSYREEYSAQANWDPVELPEVDLYFTRNLIYNEPLTNDQQVDNYQLRSRYNYKYFKMNYNHTTTDTLNKTAEFKTLSNFDDATLRFNRNYRQGKISVNSSLRLNRQEIEFSGTGDRLVSTTSAGSVIGKIEDPIPLTSDPDVTFSLATIDLLVDALLDAKQLSFGLDFGTLTELDHLLINFAELDNYNSSAFPWQVYVRDNETENWIQLAAVSAITNNAEKRFELSFGSVETRYIKIVTTPLAPPEVAAGQNLLISSLVAQRTLPPETSKFVTTDITGDTSVNWRLSDKTSTGYNILYREQRSEPFGEKNSLLNTGARIRHIFNDVFVGSMRVQRSESQKRGEKSDTNYSYSASLLAKHLDTFNQSLTYSFTHQNDKNSRTSISNSVLLRNNLDLYQGWSMYLDSGYSWQNPAEGQSNNSTLLRVSSNIVPNRWMNFTLSYGISWSRETGKPVSQDQTGRIVATWVPTSSLSLSADLAFTDETGAASDSTAEQQYSINWSPFRDGTLFFSLAYGQSADSDHEKTWTLSPTLRWQVNRKTLLSLEYALGERDDRDEVINFENISLALRFFY